MLELRDGSAKTIYDAVIMLSEDLELHCMHRLCELSSDRASVMLGRKCGVSNSLLKF